MAEPRTKVVATVGPACDTEETLGRMVEAGVDVFRLNFSHGTHDAYADAISTIRRLAAEADRPVAIMQDLQGPRIRTGRLRGGQPLELKEGETLTITPGDFEGDAAHLATSYDRLAEDVKPGDTILVSDGLIELKVTEARPPQITCRVVVGDLLGERKGMNLPGVDLSISAPTDKDLEDLAFGLAHGVDYVALSFVRKADDIARLRAAMGRTAPEGADVPIVAKIERPEALEDLAALIAHADAVMVARGDMGIEMPPEMVPAAQKKIITAANAACVPVITATQMLDSMVEHRRPTRAEASDVANAILDGTDAVMLSAETAIGRYPVLSVDVMVRIAEQIEGLLESPATRGTPRDTSESTARQHSLAAAACRVAADLGADGIVAFTMTGSTARYMSQQRPPFPIYALTPNEITYRRLALVWGVRPVMLPVFGSTDEMIERGEAQLLQMGCAQVGQTMVCVAGGSTNTPGGTDMLKIHYFDGNNPYLSGG